MTDGACVNCGRDKGAIRGRECGACQEYRREYGVARPYTADGRGERFGPGLTARQVEVWALLAEGLLDKEIGQRLAISRQTVKNHANRVYAHLGLTGGARNPRVVAAVRWAAGPRAGD